ncbi:Fic family protein [Candidatus Woesearchaeota archaeon]|nr:MAG: filamentation induced by cAMP protein fic [archaeon GW2011_AR18]MBS3161319.1 Fic family protein [Candidatus Woesearchaeota archaeon]HIH26274.1 Fic family protein [Nanoarchaeota archaeon]
MVILKTKAINGERYYYLEHSYRENNKVNKKEVYLGKNIPDNIEDLKKEFIDQVYKEKWHSIIEKIKSNYSKQLKDMPVSIKERNTESFMVKFTYDTQRIEGSTLSLKDTANLLERGITPSNKPINDIKEAEAHKKVFYDMIKCKKELSLTLILYWHKVLFEDTKKDIAGMLRKHQVVISGSKFMPPSPVEVYLLITEFFKWYSNNKKKIHPVELASLVHLKFVTIHPFGDGNGRISRLMMNYVLNCNKFPMLDIPYENRNSYYNALERSQTKKSDNIFIQWFIKNYIKENKRYN